MSKPALPCHLHWSPNVEYCLNRAHVQKSNQGPLLVKFFFTHHSGRVSSMILFDSRQSVKASDKEKEQFYASTNMEWPKKTNYMWGIVLHDLYWGRLGEHYAPDRGIILYFYIRIKSHFWRRQFFLFSKQVVENQKPSVKETESSCGRSSCGWWWPVEMWRWDDERGWFG